MTVITLNKENFDATVEKNDMVVIDFGAEWCAPCKGFSKIFSATAEKYPDVKFCSVDIEAEPGLANDFEVRSVPLIIILRQSVAVFAQAGAMPQTALEELIVQAKALDMQTVLKEIELQQKTRK